MRILSLSQCTIQNKRSVLYYVNKNTTECYLHTQWLKFTQFTYFYRFYNFTTHSACDEVTEMMLLGLTGLLQRFIFRNLITKSHFFENLTPLF